MIQLLLVDNNQHNEKRRDEAGLEEAIRRRPRHPLVPGGVVVPKRY